MVEKPAPVARRRRDTPPALAALVMRCLEKDPAQRPQSAEEFLASLDTAQPMVVSRKMKLGLVAAALVIVSAIGWLWQRPGGARDASADLSAIAVLPLVNTTGDPRDEYFSDGMTDELSTALSRVRGLRVASRTSTFAFKGRRDVDVRDIGRRLGVGTVLEGTVRRDGPRLRLAAQRRTNDLAAYDHYLRGRYFWHQRGEAALRAAATQFEQAIELDSGFAAAHAGLADVLALLPVYGTTPADSAWPLARTSAERAITLDSASAEAHTTLGLVHKSLGEWEDAERVLLRALELDPGSSAAHQWHAEVLVITGRLSESAAPARKAHQLDPLSPIVAAELGYMLTLAGEPDAGIEMGRRAIMLAPDLWTGHAFLGSSFLFAGRVAEAIAPRRRAILP